MEAENNTPETTLRQKGNLRIVKNFRVGLQTVARAQSKLEMSVFFQAQDSFRPQSCFRTKPWFPLWLKTEQKDEGLRCEGLRCEGLRCDNPRSEDPKYEDS